MRTRFKICCMSSEAEVRAAVDAGADALGFVSQMPSGAGIISEQLISRLIPLVPPPVATFLLTSQTTAAGILAQLRKCGAGTVQLCDSVSPGVREDVKSALPAVRIVQVIHVVGPESIEEALHVEKTADALLLDSGNQSLPVKELGGTGRTHDWSVSAALCRSVRVPVFLAGGLNAANVREAIETVHPFGVDVCSGVRSGGKLDPVKLSAFAGAVLT
jgi:phosphoribosylanthranilate isomerase